MAFIVLTLVEVVGDLSNAGAKLWLIFTFKGFIYQTILGLMVLNVNCLIY